MARLADGLRPNGGLLVIWFLLYVLTIPAANWAIATFGLIPVGFGLLAPAGVLFAGAALSLRDFTQESLGRWWTLVAIGIGGLLSFAVSPAQIAVASSAAFLVSEMADFLVYQPLRERGLTRALVASNVVGLTVDSALFLWLAFGSLDFLTGQLVGKGYTILPAIAVLWMMRQRRVVGAAA